MSDALEVLRSALARECSSRLMASGSAPREEELIKKLRVPVLLLFGSLGRTVSRKAVVAR